MYPSLRVAACRGASCRQAPRLAPAAAMGSVAAPHPCRGMPDRTGGPAQASWAGPRAPWRSSTGRMLGDVEARDISRQGRAAIAAMVELGLGQAVELVVGDRGAIIGAAGREPDRPGVNPGEEEGEVRAALLGAACTRGKCAVWGLHGRPHAAVWVFLKIRSGRPFCRAAAGLDRRRDGRLHASARATASGWMGCETPGFPAGLPARGQGRLRAGKKGTRRHEVGTWILRACAKARLLTFCRPLAAGKYLGADAVWGSAPGSPPPAQGRGVDNRESTQAALSPRSSELSAACPSFPRFPGTRAAAPLRLRVYASRSQFRRA